MQAVLYVSHGSRVQQTIDDVTAFIERCMPYVDVPIQELCFLELAEPSISEGIARCISRGATAIAIVPLLLLAAVHAKADIPQQIAMEMKRYPQVAFTYGQVLGIHETMITSLIDTIRRQGVEPEQEANVLLIGRGSSDEGVRQSMLTIAARLQERTAFTVDVCFLYGLKPTIDEGLAKLVTSELSQPIVVPYLLFPGVLYTGIQEKVMAHNANRQRAGQTLLQLCRPLAEQQGIRDVVVTRVRQLLKQPIVSEVI